ncbi:MAG TPA: type II CAAX endopeptidase family protein [Candidatus Limnocylindria bacterium]|nr:type II CAAX endopeptidase family protein [Candidatus Limnocylindria bacterium]
MHAGGDPAGTGPSGSLPTGPHPTIGPGTVSMPRWPGPVLIVAGAILALGSLAAATLVASGQLDVDGGMLGPLALGGALIFVAGLVYSAVRQIRIRSFLPPERYRGPNVLVLLALVLVFASVANVPFGDDATALVLGDGELTLIGATIILVSTQAALLLVSWLFVYRPRALAGLPRFPGREPLKAAALGVAWGVAAWVVSTVLIGIVAVLLQQIGMEPEPQAAERAIELLNPVLVAIAIVVVAPIAEEIFFRGVVFNAWLREGGRRFAFVGSALLFAIIHVSLLSLLPIFALGLMLAWIYDRTGTLVAPIAMHATVNGISVALAFLVRFDVVRLPV